jgi:hypothetical protein
MTDNRYSDYSSWGVRELIEELEKRDKESETCSPKEGEYTRMRNDMAERALDTDTDTGV